MRRFVLVGLLVSFIIAGVLYHFAAESPDGLETEMERVGAAEGEPLVPAPFPDYEFPLLGTVAGKTVAGVVGTALVFGLVMGLLRLLGRRRSEPSQPG